jgi:hypothetical protein
MFSICCQDQATVTINTKSRTIRQQERSHRGKRSARGPRFWSPRLIAFVVASAGCSRPANEAPDAGTDVSDGLAAEVGARAPIGWLDPMPFENVVTGWACDPDTPNLGIEVHLYFDGPAGAARVGVPGVRADQDSETAVNTACGGGIAHRFKFNVAKNLGAELGLGIHSVYAYGINTGAGGNAALFGSPGAVTLLASALEAVRYDAGEKRIAINAEAGAGVVSTYAYGPSIVNVDGRYHMWACANAKTSISDVIVHSTSADGLRWTPSQLALSPDSFSGRGETGVMFACDPSVVRFVPPGKTTSFYFLYFGMNDYGGGGRPFRGGTIGVARSTDPAGPFSVYMGGDPARDASWQRNPSRPPAFIREPARPCATIPGNTHQLCYGAGQPAVVRHDGTFHMWYMDTTAGSEAVPLRNRILHTTSQDGVEWSAATVVVEDSLSVDVKFDRATQAYVMIDYAPQLAPSQTLTFRTSEDGTSWSRPTQMENGTTATGLPAFGHNPGMTGDQVGNLTGATVLGFGAPYPGKPNLWGHWNLYVAPLTFVWR